MLAKFLNISVGDLYYIEQLADVINDESLIDDLKEELGYLKLDQINENSFISCILFRINTDVFNEVKASVENIEEGIGSSQESKKQVLLKKDALLAICDQRIEEFSPDINSMASHFLNEIDQVGYIGKRLSEISDRVFMALCTQYEEDFYESQAKGESQ